MNRLAVFASGTGSNYEAIMKAIQQGSLKAQVSLLICDQPNAAVIQKAKNYGTEVVVFDRKNYATKQTFEAAIVKTLQSNQIDWVILAGYMRLIGETILQPYQGRIINIHPSLLPSFPGLDAIGQALEAGVKITGVTIHYVDEGMDTGEIIAQEAVKLEENMTKEELQQAIQRTEHELYPRTIQQLIKKGEEKA